MTSLATTVGDGDVTYTNAATANDGKHEADNVDNWSGNAVPANNDTVTFDEGNTDCKYNLNLGCQPTFIVKSRAFTGYVGLPETNKDDTARPYREYRSPTYLTTTNNSVTTVADIETGLSGAGSGRFKWDAGAGQAVLNIYGRGPRANEGVPSVLFKGSHASNEVNNLEGDLGIAFFAGETAVVPTLRTGSGPGSQAETICSSGVTLTSTTCNGGKQRTDSAITTAIVNAGEHYHESGTITTATVNGGTLFPLGDATITTLTVGSNGTFDASKGTDTFTITNTVQLYKGASFIDPAGRAGNVVFKLNNCTLADVTIVLAPNKTFTLS